MKQALTKPLIAAALATAAHAAPIGQISNGEGKGTVRGKLNAVITEVNNFTTTTDAIASDLAAIAAQTNDWNTLAPAIAEPRVAPTNSIHIVIAGQSNADGSVQYVSPLVPREYIDSTGGAYESIGVTNAWLVDTRHNYTGILQTVDVDDWGFELGMGHVLADGTNAVYISKYGNGGTGLDPDSNPSWLPSEAELYTNIPHVVSVMNSTYPASGDPDVLVWVQGEWDAGFMGNDFDYAAGLAALIAEARADLAVPDLPVIVVGLNDWYLDVTHGIEVTEAQMAVADADPNVHYLPMTEFGHETDSHYFEDEYWTGGLKIGGAIRGVLSKSAISAGGLSIAGPLYARSISTGPVVGSDATFRSVYAPDLSDRFGTLRPMLADSFALRTRVDFANGVVSDSSGTVTAWNTDSATIALDPDPVRGHVLDDGYFHTDTGVDLSAYGGSFTFASWIYCPDGADNSGVLFALRSVANDYSYARVRTAGSDAIRAQLKMGAASTIEGQNAIMPDTWTHVAVTYDATTTAARMYYNGTLCGEGSSATNRVYAGRVYFREAPVDGDPSDIKMDDCVYYSRALDQAEVGGLYGRQALGETGVRRREEGVTGSFDMLLTDGTTGTVSFVSGVITNFPGM